MSDAPRRPMILLAMMDGMLGYALRPQHVAALGEVGELLCDDAVSDFADPRFAGAMARAEVLVGHWGCPTLTAEALVAMPRLEMFAYARGDREVAGHRGGVERGLLVTERGGGQRRTRRRVRGRCRRAGQQGAVLVRRP